MALLFSKIDISQWKTHTHTMINIRILQCMVISALLCVLPRSRLQIYRFILFFHWQLIDLPINVNILLMVVFVCIQSCSFSLDSLQTHRQQSIILSFFYASAAHTLWSLLFIRDLCLLPHCALFLAKWLPFHFQYSKSNESNNREAVSNFHRSFIALILVFLQLYLLFGCVYGIGQKNPVDIRCLWWNWTIILLRCRYTISDFHDSTAAPIYIAHILCLLFLQIALGMARAPKNRG